MKITLRIFTWIWMMATLAMSTGNWSPSSVSSDEYAVSDYHTQIQQAHSASHSHSWVAEDSAEEFDFEGFDAIEQSSLSHSNTLVNTREVRDVIPTHCSTLSPPRLYAQFHQWRFHLS